MSAHDGRTAPPVTATATARTTTTPPFLTADALAALPGVRHGFFTRAGGVCDGPFASLHAGLTHPEQLPGVRENRARIARALGLAPDRLLSARQVHGTAVVEVGEPWSLDQLPEADGLVTRRRGVALGVLGADCAPLLFVDPFVPVIGACHAGWRGARAGIVQATVRAMVACGAETGRIIAALGPCIGRESYEVGADFVAAFADDSEAQALFHHPNGPEARAHFDLLAFCRLQAARAGLGHIVERHADTCVDAARFFSNRRTAQHGGGPYGLQLSAIALA